MTYYLDGEDGPYVVNPHLFDQVLSVEPMRSFLVCDCGELVSFGAECPRCSPAPEPARPSLWRRLVSRLRKETHEPPRRP